MSNYPRVEYKNCTHFAKCKKETFNYIIENDSLKYHNWNHLDTIHVNHLAQITAAFIYLQLNTTNVLFPYLTYLSHCHFFKDPLWYRRVVCLTDSDRLWSNWENILCEWVQYFELVRDSHSVHRQSLVTAEFSEKFNKEVPTSRKKYLRQQQS